MKNPDLTLDITPAEGSAPWNLNALLYLGGAGAHLREVQSLIDSGSLGPPLTERIPLVQCLCNEINARVALGYSVQTTLAARTQLRVFFDFADRSGRPLTLDTVTQTYCAWADSLVHRVRLPESKAKKVSDQRRLRKLSREDRPIKHNSAYVHASTVGNLLDLVLNRHTSIIELTGLTSPTQRKSAAGVQAEKQNLEDTFAFGHFIRSVCETLTLDVVCNAPLPYRLGTPDSSADEPDGLDEGQVRPTFAVATKNALINLRIEVELFMFIGQTAMNVAQAYRLERQEYAYISHIDGYQVKTRKERRHGQVLFEIFSAYKAHFEAYLAWREALFPDSTELFPFITTVEPSPHSHFQGFRVRQLCTALGIPHIAPSSLRGTRVNWLLRRTGDEDQTAEMAQHTKETLRGVYLVPSLQRALVEAARFWAKNDPHLKLESVAPGDCTGTPKRVADAPKAAPKPDCLRPSGCLWGENHRDVDSFDYVWSLSSFRHLKVIELSKARSPNRDNNSPPALLAIDRIVEKTRWFEESNEARREWVIEAEARLNEGHFHPDWRDVIQELEGSE